MDGIGIRPIGLVPIFDYNLSCRYMTGILYAACKVRPLFVEGFTC